MFDLPLIVSPILTIFIIFNTTLNYFIYFYVLPFNYIQIGFPYVITYNVDLKDAIANGTEVELVYIEQHPQLDSEISCTLWFIPPHNSLTGHNARQSAQHIPY